MAMGFTTYPFFDVLPHSNLGFQNCYNNNKIFTFEYLFMRRSYPQRKSFATCRKI